MFNVRIDGIGSAGVSADSPAAAVEVYARSRPDMAPGSYVAIVRSDEGEESVPFEIRRTIVVGKEDASALTKLVAEIERSRRLHPRPMASAHEGYGVIAEEFDELKAEIWRKEGERDPEAMECEAVQVACAAIRFVEEVCEGASLRKDAEPVWVVPPAEAQALATGALRRVASRNDDASEAPFPTAGLAIASVIASGSRVDARRLAAFFARQDGNCAAARSKGARGEAAMLAWAMRGGDAMRRAVETAMSQAGP